jgi:hypothetical protein
MQKNLPYLSCTAADVYLVLRAGDVPGLRSCCAHRGRCNRRRATTEKDTVFYSNFLLFLKCSVYPLPVMEEEFDYSDFNLLTLPLFKRGILCCYFLSNSNLPYLRTFLLAERSSS